MRLLFPLYVLINKGWVVLIVVIRFAKQAQVSVGNHISRNGIKSHFLLYVISCCCESLTVPVYAALDLTLAGRSTPTLAASLVLAPAVVGTRR